MRFFLNKKLNEIYVERKERLMDKDSLSSISIMWKLNGKYYLNGIRY